MRLGRIAYKISSSSFIQRGRGIDIIMGYNTVDRLNNNAANGALKIAASLFYFERLRIFSYTYVFMPAKYGSKINTNKCLI